MKIDKNVEKQYYELLGIDENSTREEIINSKKALEQDLFLNGNTSHNIMLYNSISRWIDSLPIMHYEINSEKRDYLCSKLGIDIDSSDNIIINSVVKLGSNAERENLSLYNKLIQEDCFSYSRDVIKPVDEDKKSK